MPNFTITRQIEPEDIIGCTDFETTQEEGVHAAIGPAELDGDIIWYIDANLGFIVDLMNFSIPSAINTNVLQTPLYKTFQNPIPPAVGLIPDPILGVVMEQLSPTTIKVTIYLVPSVLHAITGTPFAMPSNNISVALPISGCAEPTPIEV